MKRIIFSSPKVRSAFGGGDARAARAAEGATHAPFIPIHNVKEPGLARTRKFVRTHSNSDGPDSTNEPFGNAPKVRIFSA